MMFHYDCLRFPAVLVVCAVVIPSLDLHLIPSWCRDLCVSLSAAEMPLLGLSMYMSWIPQCCAPWPFVACLPHCFVQAEVQQIGQLLTIDVTQTQWKSKQTSLPASLGFGQTPWCNSFG